MNFLRTAASLASNSPAAQQLVQNLAGRTAAMFQREAKDLEISTISESAMRSLILLDSNATTSLYKNSASFQVIYRPTRKVLLKTPNEVKGKIMANRLNMLFGGVNEDPLKPLTDAELVKIAGMALKNPGWSEVHLACALGLVRTLKSSFQQNGLVLVNTPTADPNSAVFPLHIACEHNQYEAAMLCISAGAKPEKLGSRGETAYHVAARSGDLRLMQALLAYNSAEAIRVCVDAEDLHGFTPLQEAIRNENFDGLKKILSDLQACRNAKKQVLGCLVGYQIKNYETWKYIAQLICAPQLDWLIQMNSSGDAVLHLKLEPDVLRVICSHADSGTLELPNGRGMTPLQAAIARDDLAACVCFVSFGADVNKRTQESCIQLALKYASPTVLQLLILLGAKMEGNDSQLVNQRDKAYIEQIRKMFSGKLEPSLDAAMRAHLLSENTIRIRDALLNTVPSNKQLAISLDGGGIRGLAEAQMLFELQRILGDSFLPRIEWLGGTSTGSILAIGLALGKSPQDCIRLYLRFKDEVFRGDRPYSEQNLEKCLQNEFKLNGQELRMVDVKKKLLVTAAQTDVSPAEIVVFRSYQLPNEAPKSYKSLGSAGELKLWQAARCSSAAPTYFSAPHGCYMDGGLIANNPTSEVLSDIQVIDALGPNKVKPAAFLSLGTGIPPTRRVGESTPDAGILATLMARLNVTVVHTLHMLTEQISAANGVVVSRSAGFCLAMGIPFFRFSPPLAFDIELDARDDKTLIEMMWTSRNYINTHPDLKKLVEYMQK